MGTTEGAEKAWQGKGVAPLCMYAARKTQIGEEVKTQVEFSMDSGSTEPSCFEAD